MAAALKKSEVWNVDAFRIIGGNPIRGSVRIGSAKKRSAADSGGNDSDR